MKRLFLLVFVASTTCTAAEAQVTHQFDVPDPHGGLLVNHDVDLDFNESRVVRWSPGETVRYALSQNFKVNSNITMDKYAVQLRADATVATDAVQLPSGDAPISVSLWELPDLSDLVYGYPAASVSVGGVPKATWTLTVGADNNTSTPGGAAAGDWLIFDTPNIALTAGVQYGVQLAWPTVTQEVGQKIWFWVSNPDVFPDGFPVDQMANAIQGDPTVDASYIKTYRSQNFAIIAASAPTPGDYNGDGKVDAADYVLWRKSPNDFGGNPAGYTTWRSNFGNPAGSGSGLSLASVPEPGAILLVAAAISLVSCCRERRFGRRVG